MSATSAKKAIMVVEDDQIIRDSIVEILESEGYSTVAAENGDVAIKFLHSAVNLPGLILLDVMMPVMDGWAFRSKQSSDTRLSSIPVIVVTADGNAQEKARKMAAQGWVKKPIDIDMLIHSVQKFV